MKNLIANFPQHISEAVATLKATQFKPNSQPILNVVITGLGGSGIGGTIVAELAAPHCNVPICVNKNYSLPGFVNQNTLLIACSYSGNTEETLTATKLAISKGAQVACISSGGELQQIATEKGFNILSMTGGNPPRSMFAYSFAYLCYILDFYNVASFNVIDNLESAVQLLSSECDSLKQEAEVLAKKLTDKTAILYAVSGGVGVASRWRQQLNENAKMLAWEAEIPEMNHNELVGWEGGNSSFAALYLRHHTDFDRNQKRIEINKNIISEKTDTVLEVWSKGESAIERSLYLIHLGDWVSYYLSEINAVDIMDIKSIDLLKAELSKLPQ